MKLIFKPNKHLPELIHIIKHFSVNKINNCIFNECHFIITVMVNNFSQKTTNLFT